MFANAGPETESSGAFFGFGGMFVAFITLLFAPLSFLVFLISGIKRHSYQKPNTKTMFSVLFQIASLVYVIFWISALSKLNG